MECRIYTESLTAFIDGELAGEEASTIRAHLLVCPSCDAEYRSLFYSYELVGKARLIDSRATTWAVIENRIRTPKEDRSLLHWLFPNVWVPVTAIAGLILFTSLLFLFVPSDNHSVAMRQVLDKYVQERDREFGSKGIMTSQGVLTLQSVQYNPFRDADPKPKGNPFKAE